MNKVITHLLVAALAIGGWVFVVDIMPGVGERHIVVSAEDQADIREQYRLVWGRQPDEDEFAALINDFAREEMAYREGRRRGLGADDVTVRNQLRAILEANAVESLLDSDPADEELRTYFDANSEAFRVDPGVAFTQIFFDADESDIGRDAAARFLLGRLETADLPEDISTLGDPFEIPAEIEMMPVSEVAALFGDQFAIDIAGLSVNSWQGPFRSIYGLHLVRIDARDPGSIPEFDAAQAAIREAWIADQVDQRVDELYRTLSDDYRVTVEQPAQND